MIKLIFDDKIVEEKEILGLIEKVKSRGQGFYEVVERDEVLEKIFNFVEAVKGKFEKIVVLGIGGSALGTICLNEALKNFCKKEKVEEGGYLLYSSRVEEVELLVLDNVDPEEIVRLESQIVFEKTLFLVITKSGGTPETLAQMFYFRERVEERGLKFNEHFVVVTDPEKGLLRKIAIEEGLIAFDIPENVGGRFSVLTAVGLLPMALLGKDIKALLEGAKNMKKKVFSLDVKENLAYVLAKMKFDLYKNGVNEFIMMPYCNRLFRFADWYRQLLAESIGKAKKRNGEEVFVGITPVNALGVTDQHSQVQLYNEGPKNKLLMFLEVEKMIGSELRINVKEGMGIDYLNGVTFEKLLKTELEATFKTLKELKRPCFKMVIEKINEFTLGEMFMLFEMEIALLGEMFEVDSFDQPGVERAKILTKEMLIKSEFV